LLVAERRLAILDVPLRVLQRTRPSVQPTATQLAALTCLAVAVTAVVSLAWYMAVERLGVTPTGLFNGLIPGASLAAVAVVGTGTVTSTLILGAVAIVAGLIVGLTGPADHANHPSYAATVGPSRGAVADRHPRRRSRPHQPGMVQGRPAARSARLATSEPAGQAPSPSPTTRATPVAARTGT